MPNYKTVKDLSIETGVSITTIRHFLKLDMLTCTEGRPIKIDADNLPVEFTCLYDPNYILITEFAEINNIPMDEIGMFDDMEEKRINSVLTGHFGVLGFVLSPKQNGGDWVYINPVIAHKNLNEWMQDYYRDGFSMAVDFPTLFKFAKRKEPKLLAQTIHYLRKPSITVVFSNEKDRQKWVRTILQEDFTMTALNEVIEYGEVSSVVTDRN